MKRLVVHETKEEKHIILADSIYTPARQPGKALLLVSFIVLVGVLGSFFSRFFMIFANIFWITYTSLLVYLQFLNKSNYDVKNFLDHLLNPQVRFFVFIFLGTMAVFGALLGKMWVGYTALAAWWLFSLNFYLYFKEFKKHH